MNLTIEECVEQLNAVYGKYVTKNDDVASILIRDDVDSLINLLSTNKTEVDKFENCYDQGLLHMAGSFN